MRPRLKTASARLRRLGQHAARLGRGQVAVGDHGDEGQVGAQRQRRVDRAGPRPSWPPPARRTRWRRRSRGARRSAAATAKGSSAPAAAAAAAARAADDPRPRATGICERTVTAKRSCPSTSVATRAARCEASSKRPAPSPSVRTDSDGRRLDLDADVAVERPRPACRSPGRGWPTRRGPGRAPTLRLRRGQKRRWTQRDGRGTSCGSRTGTTTCCVPSVTTTVPTACRRGGPGRSDRGVGIETLRRPWLPGQVSTTTDEPARASTVVPASLDPGHHAARRSDRRRARWRCHGVGQVQRGRPAATRTPALLPGDRGHHEGRHAVHAAHHGQDVAPAGLRGEAGLHPDDAVEPEERRVGRDGARPPAA